ncbi:glycosyltransferase family 4 protein [Agromyces atrinae]|uniref:Glycosyltransferase involved in cell wall biosynthesis n=1 Tax=Agromyces atrinae TaxID=592376 RepID=A0A852SIU1_9MICO|nr:glycosyltransferase family 4 protein [Agromyces atrinae]NYD68415.1 glycosyltransferase involved in cell wall biosynthesis [Agromyces atrinae]
MYDVVRTAHLERIVDRPGTVVLYRSRRYDFDESIAGRVDLRRAGVVGAFVYGLRHRIDVIEINEPFIARAAPRSLAVILGARLRAAVTRSPRARVVTYAIASLDPRDLFDVLPARARWRGRLHQLLVPAVWSFVDRIAYGTSLARSLYRARFGRSRAQPTATLVPALPVRADEPLPAVAEPTIVFLGDLSERKGFVDVLDAWPIVARHVPEARLRIIGRGVGEDAACDLAAADDAVTVDIDPPRPVIFAALREAKVLTLPSRRRPLWREQVGLPIVEGLARGCEIVTTPETGLAEWLDQHGHAVVTEAESLADALVGALRSTRSPSDIVADLPPVDGRVAAHDWLMDDAIRADEGGRR